MPASPHAFLLVVLEVIFVCPVDGVPLYTDRPCPEGREYSIGTGNVVDRPALTAEERQTLERIARGPKEATTRPKRAGRRSDRDADCRAAEAGLAELRAVRRRGYRVGEAGALEAREEALRAARDASCGT